MNVISCEDESEKILSLLIKMPTLAGFGSAGLRRLVGVSELCEFSAGQAIIREGDRDRFVYFLVSGSVAVIKGGVKVNVIRRSGDIFGEMGMIDGNVRSATVAAQDHTVCVRVDADHLEGEWGQAPVSHAVLYRAFAEVLAQRLRKMNQEIEYLRKELSAARALSGRK